MKIGVFDSGIGGLSVAIAIEKQFPEHEVVFLNDSKNVPYGNKSLSEIYNLTKPFIKKLIKQNCKIIVIACNTISTNLDKELMLEFPEIKFIFIVPMVKTACEFTKTKKITVCATPRTLKSKVYHNLKHDYAKNISVYEEPDVSDWSLMIENNDIDTENINRVVEKSIEFGSDVFVLGCTHYHWIQEIIAKKLDGHAIILQPETAVNKRIKQDLEQLA